MLRVVHIMSGFGGGISSFIKNKAIALKDEAIFDVITFDKVNKEFEKIINNTGGDIIQVPNPKTEGWVSFYKKVNFLFNNLDNETIVHAHIEGHRVLPFYLIAKKNHIKRFLVHAHTDAEESERNKIDHRINRRINSLMHIERVSCGIKASENIFGKNTIANKPIMHVPNSINKSNYTVPIDTMKYKEEVYGESHKDKIIIGSVARFHEQKNHQFMLDIIQDLKEVTKDFLWVFIGDGELKKTIVEEVKKRDLEPYVMFLGRRSDVPELYKTFDYFVLPSLYEGLPTVAIEAQAAGTYTVMSDTITKESDLGLGLVKFLPIDNTQGWVKELQKKPDNTSEQDLRLDVIDSKKFSNESSAELYLNYLKKNIKQYNI